MSMTMSRAQQVDIQRRVLFDSLADGYYESNLEGNLLVTNRSLRRLLGCDDPAQIVGEAYNRFVDAANLQRLKQAAQRVLKSGEALPAIDCPITRADGERRVFEVSIAQLRDNSAQAVGYHGTVRDITQRARSFEHTRQAEALQDELQILRQQYAELSDLEQLKTHMIRVTAHDLRSPLSIISSYIELLDEDLAPQFNEMDVMYVSAIRQAVARIMQLTTDILTLERLNQYQDVTLMRVQLGKLLERTVQEFSDNSRQRHQTVNLNSEALAVYGDSVDLHEAIANLVGNAIKYTPDGGTIEARLAREGDFAVLEISDSGYGIPEEQQNELFQPFHRIKTRETQAIDGTGLGLYLVKKIVERHGGTIHFQSSYGKGSTFGFRLPLAKLGE